MSQAIPVILAVVSTAASVYSTVQSGRSEEKAEKKAARAARSAAAQRALDEEKRHRRIIASQRARYAASGLELEGTPLLVEMESLRESEEQLRRIRAGGEVDYEIGMERAKGAQISGYVGAIGSASEGVYKIGQTRDWWK